MITVQRFCLRKSPNLYFTGADLCNETSWVLNTDRIYFYLSESAARSVRYLALSEIHNATDNTIEVVRFKCTESKE